MIRGTPNPKSILAAEVVDMLLFQCRACGEVHAILEWIFHELAPDGIWTRCPQTNRYSLHKLLSGQGSPGARENGAGLAGSRLAKELKIGRVKERVRTLLEVGAS